MNTITEVLFRTSVVLDKNRCTKGALKHAEYIMATLISTGILQSWCAGHEFFMITVQCWPAVNWWRSNTAKISINSHFRLILPQNEIAFWSVPCSEVAPGQNDPFDPGSIPHFKFKPCTPFLHPSTSLPKLSLMLYVACITTLVL